MVSPKNDPQACSNDDPVLDQRERWGNPKSFCVYSTMKADLERHGKNVQGRIYLLHHGFVDSFNDTARRGFRELVSRESPAAPDIYDRVEFITYNDDEKTTVGANRNTNGGLDGTVFYYAPVFTMLSNKPKEDSVGRITCEAVAEFLGGGTKVALVRVADPGTLNF